MSLTINAIVLGVSDINRAKQFYSSGLGCQIGQEQGPYISFSLGDDSPTLALYTREALAVDAGVDAAGSGFTGVTLHYFAPSDERVDEVLTQAEKAGGTITNPAQRSQWGGYFGYFSDPDGYLWKVVSTA